MSFFIGTSAEGDKFLTTAGYTALILLVIALILVGNAIFGKKKKFSALQLAYSAMGIALATVLSLISIFHLPQGGSVTPCSMLFVVLIGYWFGPGVGFTTAIAYGALQLMIDPYILSIPQLLLDYIFAFGALGLSGFFYKKQGKYSLIIAYIVAITGRFLFSFLSGVIFFGDFASASSFMGSVWYSISYNGSYIYLEGIITVVLLLIPAVRAGLNAVRNMAIRD